MGHTSSFTFLPPLTRRKAAVTLTPPQPVALPAWLRRPGKDLYICEGCQGKDRLDSVLPNRAELGQWGEATGRQIEAPWKEEPSELLAQFTLE